MRIERSTNRTNELQIEETNEEENDKIDEAVNSSQQWHDVKVIQSDNGNQELVIENLENLQDTTALIVTRENGQFKIGI